MPQQRRKPAASEKPAAKVEDVKEPEAPEAPMSVPLSALVGAEGSDAAAPLPDGYVDMGTSDEVKILADGTTLINGEPAVPDPDEDEGEEGDELETGTVDVPCRKCFPDGWPAAEHDAFVNCGHNFGIRYGDQVEITRERAVELGFLDEE